MRRTTRFMAVALVALLAVVLMGAKLPGVTPAPGENKPQQRVNLTSRQSAGVYYVADSYGLQNIYLIHGGSLAGTLYMCNETDADSDGDGSVDTAAECVSLGSIGADLTLEGRKGTRRFIVIDIDTAEADGTPSKLTIFGTNDQVSSNGGGSPFDSCRPSTPGGSSSVKGGGLDSTTGKYAWTCGNYAWSAEVGGIDANGVSDYNTPTTAGGNSWTLECSGDGSASNGTAQEGTVCLSSTERIRMYSMADIMLAHDNTQDGGYVFLPNGIYHNRYCGQDADQNANGCPVLSRSPEHQQRKIQMTNGIMLIGESQDPNGPLVGGRTGMWLVMDTGADEDDDGTLSDDVSDPGGTSGYEPSHHSLRVGWGGNERVENRCARPDGSTGCVTSDSAVVNYDLDPLGVIGRSTSLVVDDFATVNGATPELCIDNRVAAGVCDEDPRVLCTSNSGGRTGANTGDCSVVSGTASCVGVADAVKIMLDDRVDSANEGSLADTSMFAVVKTYSQDDYGTAGVATSTTQSAVGLVRWVDTGTTCNSGDGRYVQFGGFWDYQQAPPPAGGSELDRFNMTQTPFYDQSAQSNQVIFTTPENFINQGGGFSQINVMPGSWDERDSATDAADCSSIVSGQDEACDDIELMALGGGLGGGVYDSTFWFGGGNGGFAFSNIDGSTTGFGLEFKRNLVAYGHGLQTDASSWIFEDNKWMNVDATGASKYIMAVGFNPGFRMSRDRFENIAGAGLFQLQGATGASIRDITINSADMGGAIVLLRSARRLLIDGITGFGNKGLPIEISPDTGRDVFDVVIRNVMLDNQTREGSATPFAMVAANDFGATGGNVTGPVLIENVSMSVHGDDSFCALFMAGGTGDESDSDNGSGRTVDDWRHFLTFKNFSLEHVDDGTGISGTLQATCLGNRDAAQNDPSDTLDTFAASEGGMPRWENIYVGGVKYPDNPRNSVPASQVPDCEDLPHGTVVTIHDDTTAGGTCADSGSDGQLDGGATAPNQFTSTCVCNPAGDSGDGAWSAL